ncbi:RagB/SusD family nutrient uptake outer membrane protein [Sphingobacterium paucimobilis]|uniref:Carbohydrate-binding protein SusD n=1 Tax=Sphingobacterium paucimobilis HER1398 TaxID=1346330 RepID=U2HAT1_9SPHI|nr:RagB/SusD family nutrient uptake outer membrane protein [Sphingobacterium paucimobilis]ERJ58856.1 hypothetical protein M472_08745 [Sphingobacterium paucimobilis HER1398]
MSIHKIFKIAIIPALLSLGSCDNFLDVVPKGVVIPQTLADYEALLSAPLVVTRTSNNAVYATDEIILPEEHRAGAGGYPGRHAVNTYDYLPEHYDVSENDEDWNAGYKAIYTYNTVIQGIADNKEVDQTKKNRLKGESLVHRAFTYLSLVNQYAKHYSGTAGEDLGVPLPMKPDINALLSRSTVAEVYQQIENDLLESIDLLPETPTYKQRPSKGAALGLLARMYLYKGNWEKSFDYANQTLAINSFLYDYNTFSYADPSNRSGVLNGYPTAINEKKHIIFNKYLLKVGGLGFQFLITPAQYALYQPGDLRELFGTSPKGYTSALLPFQGVLEMNGAYEYNNGGLTTQEIYLIRAEAAARLNKLPEALESLNGLRQHRFTTSTFKALASNDKNEVLDWVLNERRIELAFLGHRLIDIKRLNLEGRNISIARGDKLIQANDPRMVFPIPAKNISINPNLTPNPR